MLFGEEAIGVTGTIDIEADECAIVVEAVDNGGADAIGVIDGLPLGMGQGIGDQEAVHHTIAVNVGADDLVIFVDAKGSGVGRSGEIELGESLVFEQEASSGSRRCGQEADDIAIVIDTGGSRADRVRRNDGTEMPVVLV